MLLLISVTFSMLVVAHVCIFFQRVAGQEEEKDDRIVLEKSRVGQQE